MTDYPINSTAKVYHDIEGNPITLHKLIREEPEWAHSRIKVCEALEAKQAKALELIKEHEMNSFCMEHEMNSFCMSDNTTGSIAKMYELIKQIRAIYTEGEE